MKKFLNFLFLLVLPFSLFSQNVRISDMPTAVNLTGAYVPIIQGGINKKAPSSLFGGGGGGFALTTNFNSGSATFLGGVLNIPTYTLSGLGGITLNDLSVVAPLTYNSSIGQFGIPKANATTDGYLSSSDWNLFSSNSGITANALTISSELISGGPLSFNGSVARSIAIQPLSVTNSMLQGSIDLTTKVTGLLPDGNISSASIWNSKENVLTFSAPLSRSTNTISIPLATNSVDGYLSSTDRTNFNTAYSNRIASFTTVGANGASTFSGNVLNIPNYTLSGLGGVPSTRNINTSSPLAGGGDLSADRTISISDAAADGSTKGAASFTASDFNSSSGNISIDYTNGQIATGSINGFLSSSDWTNFNTAYNRSGTGLTFTSSTFTFTKQDASTLTVSVPTFNQNTTGSAAKWTTARNLAGNSVDGSVNVAFSNKFIVQGTTDSGLSGAQFLGALGTGLVKNTTTTGILSIAVAGTDYQSPITFGTGVLTALGINVGTSGSFVVNGGALGTPASGDFSSGTFTWPTFNQNTTGSAAKWTTGRTISITGDLAYTSPSIDGTSNVTASGTLATVNSNVGTFGSATQVPQVVYNGKGLATSVSNITITPAVGSITGLGTGVGTWLATPSWTNFNAAITGTAPYWALTGTSTLSGATTIAGNIANGLIFSHTFTASTNSQYALNITGTQTLRSTANDAFSVLNFNPTTNISSTLQDASFLNINGSYNMTGNITSGSTSTVPLSSSGLSGMGITTYTSVAPASTSGSGTGALFTIVIFSATTAPTTITCTTSGNNYKVGDNIVFNGSQFGGSGSFTFRVAKVSVTLGANAAPVIITHNVPLLNGLVNKNISFRDDTGSEIGSLATLFDPGTSQKSFAIYDRVGQALLFNGTTISTTRNLTVSGALSFTSVAATSFIGNVANSPSSTSSIYSNTGNVRVSAASVNAATYRNTATMLVGVVSSLNTLVGGSGYTNGAYTNVPLTGGSGTNVQANITVSAGAVTSCTIPPGFGGQNYTQFDVLSATAASIGGTGSGFTITVATVDFSGVTVPTFSDSRSIVDAKSSNEYATVLSDGSVNITSSQAGSLFALHYKMNHISTGSFGVYNMVYEPSGSKGGIGQTAANTDATWRLTGSASTPTLKIVGAGTSTNYGIQYFDSGGSTNAFAVQDNGRIFLKAVAQTTLAAGTKAVTVTGVTTSSQCFANVVTQGGTVTTTVEYGCVCTANTVTITALTNSGTTNASDTSIINYWVAN